MARLYTDGRFEKQLRDQFDGDFKISFNLAPPIIGGGSRCAGAAEEARVRRLDAAGVPGAGEDARPARHGFRHFRAIPPDRRLERDLIAGYEKDVAAVLGALSPLTLDTAIEIALAAGPHPRLRTGEGEGDRDAKARYAQLAADLVNPPPAPRQIAAE